MTNSKQSTAGAAPFSSADLQRAADEHDVLPGTILKVWCGLPVRGRAAARAERAVESLRRGRGKK